MSPKFVTITSAITKILLHFAQNKPRPNHQHIKLNSSHPLSSFHHITIIFLLITLHPAS